jgi:hypothetical protein
MPIMKFGDYAQKLFEDFEVTNSGEGTKENQGLLAADADTQKPNGGVTIDPGSTAAEAEDIELKEDGDELEGTMVGSDQNIEPATMNDDSKKELMEAMKWWKGKSLKEQEKAGFRLFKGMKKKEEMKKKGMKKVGFKK